MSLIFRYRKKVTIGLMGAFVCLILISENYIIHHENAYYRLNRSKKNQDLSFIPINDTNCITSFNGWISRNQFGDFIIPSHEVLMKLPNSILECLYRRYTTTLQSYCAKHSHHGSLDRNWVVCLDDCCKPDDHTIVVAISLRDDYPNVYSVSALYNSTIFRFAPRAMMTKRTEYNVVLMPKTSREKTDKRRYWTINHVRDELKNRKVFKNILIIDVEQYTEMTFNQIFHSDILKYVQQVSVRVMFEDTSHIDYIPVLKNLQRLYDNEFRIFWFSRDITCVSVRDKKRINCLFIYLVYKYCRNSWNWLGVDHGHEIIPINDLNQMKSDQMEKFMTSRYLTSVQVHCKEIIRLGNSNDGGWEVCHDIEYRPRYPCLVYSFGINWDFGFDDEVVNTYGCKVHSFDPSMEYTKNRQGIQFHKIGLSDKKAYFDSKRKWNMTTLKDIRSSLQHSSTRIDILKIDIEWDEWRVLPNILSTGALAGVLLLLIELHAPVSSERIKVVNDLYQQKFRIFWYHRNHFCRRQKAYIEYSVCFNLGLVRV